MTDEADRLPTISNLIDRYLDSVEHARGKSTRLAYNSGFQSFRNFLRQNNLDPDTSLITELSEAHFGKFIRELFHYKPATERLYLQAVKNLYLFVDAENLVHYNQSRLTMLLRQRARKPGKRVPRPQLPYIDKLLDEVADVTKLYGRLESEQDQENAKLRAYRDRAFLVTLADTGFRVHEACNLKRGDIDWRQQQTIIIGKGDKEALVRLTSRSLKAVDEYLAQRAVLDGQSGKLLASLPLFARHDRASAAKIKPMTTQTGRLIVKTRVEQFLGPELVGLITPHTFRHYFVTAALNGTGNLAVVQRLARHENIAVTEKYTELSDAELNRAYYEVFEKGHDWEKKHD